MRLPAAPLTDVRLAIFDLDGTLLNGEKTISSKTEAALEGLSEAGILSGIATARTPMMTGVFRARTVLNRVPLIALDGAEISAPERGEVFSRREIGRQTAEELMTYCHESGLEYTFYTPEAAWLRRDSKRLWRMEQYDMQASRMGLAGVPRRCYEHATPRAIADCGVLKIIVDDPGGSAREELGRVARGYQDVRIDSSESGSLTIVERGVSKGAAVEALCHMLGIAQEAVCCFGDYQNDIGMLRFAGHSVAMGNAAPEVQAAARYVTKSNTQEGVAWFARRYLIPNGER